MPDRQPDRPPDQLADADQAEVLLPALHAVPDHLLHAGAREMNRDLGFGRIGASEIEAPNVLANLVYCGCAVGQSDNATKPHRDRDLRFAGQALTRHHPCPGQKPPIWAVKRPARPCKSATQTRFTVEKA